jgi:hypothetical protein
MPVPQNASDRLPVLGLFADEAGLRDHIASNLHKIEAGLELLRLEYVLDNPLGAGGRIDILARDRFDHVVCIEIKRSDQSARAALHELSKYVSLLHERDRVPREIVRCIVISTHWSELLLPLSYFATSSGVDVVALNAIAVDNVVHLEPVELRQLRFLPQLCPAMEAAWFDQADLRDRYVGLLKERSSALPFMRLALLLLEPKRKLEAGRSPFAVVVCVWRAPDAHLSEIERVTGSPLGSGFPYAASGWEAELDAVGWIDDVFEEIAGPFGFNYVTSESLRNLLAVYHVARLERLGDWPKLEFINDQDRIIEAVLARSPLGGSERPNRYSYEENASPAIVPSWRLTVEGFLRFINFEPVWRDQADAFLEAIPAHYDVHLHAFDKKHLFYAIHQARAHPETMLSFFTITVTIEGEFVTGMVGFYEWDGRTCPADARKAIESVYGSTTWAVLSADNAVDDRRYEAALPLHGFTPQVDVFVSEDDLAQRGVEPGGPRDFVKANEAYAREVSEIMESLGPLPTDPAS